MNTAPTVFCDSADAWRAAVADGLRPDSTILTTSPHLAHHLRREVTFLPHRLTEGQREGIQALRRVLQYDAVRCARELPRIADLSEVAALTAFLALDLLSLAACLGPSDFDEPHCILRADCGTAIADRTFNGPWPALLQNASGEQRILTYPVIPSAGTRWDVVPSSDTFRRFQIAGWRRLAYRLIASGRLPTPFVPRRSGGEILVLDANELVQETAATLALRGCRIRFVPASVPPLDLDAGVSNDLHELCSSVFDAHLKSLVHPSIHEPLLRLVSERLIQRATLQRSARRFYGNFIDALPMGPRRMVLTNYPARPERLALAQLCREKGIPFAGFQHGVSSEICEDHDSTFSSYEAFICSHNYVFNRKAAAVANAIPMRRGMAETVGMPGDFRRTGRRAILSRKKQAILFASTAAYAGYSGKINYGPQSDLGMLEFEIEVLQAVLGKLHHPVVYKSYPATRFVDSDPVLEIAKALPNVNLSDDFVDLRYLLASYPVVVTARATSTLSWCVMSGKPVVFIDTADSMRLRPDILPLFQDGIFVFSTQDTNWASALRNFLDQPIAEIERQWRERHVARHRLIAACFDDGGAAATRAADRIEHALHTVSDTPSNGLKRRFITTPTSLYNKGSAE